MCILFIEEIAIGLTGDAILLVVYVLTQHSKRETIIATNAQIN